MFTLKILHDGKQNELSFPTKDDLTVGELKSALESKFKVLRGKQKLIFRGKSLVDEESRLTSYNITSGSKIMLIGQIEVADFVEIQKLKDLEDRLLELQQQSASFNSYLNTSSDSKMRKNEVLAFTESCMKSLEIADAVILPPTEEILRKRRKGLVNMFLDLVNSAEAILTALESPLETNK